jgi:uncharacterized membrane protein
MKQWQCTVCGYIHEGPEPPEHCPVCGAERSKFVLLAAAAPEPSRPSQPQPALRLHLHPILAHFPNGLMPIVWLFLLLSWWLGRSALDEAALWMVGIVTLVAPLSLATGIYDWQKRFGGEKAPIFTRKIALAIALLILGGLALFLRIAGGAGLQSFYYLCLAGMLGCVTLLGYYGGKLAFSTPPRH